MRKKIIYILSLTWILMGVSLFFATQLQSSEPNHNSIEVIYGVNDETLAYDMESEYNIKLLSFSNYGYAVYETSENQLPNLIEQGFELNNTYQTALPPWKLPDSDSDPLINNQYALDMLNVHEAWLETVGSLEVVIAIIDTGIDTDHEEFIGRISPQSYNSRTKEIGILYVEDDNGHGTLVSGIIGANRNNSKGIAGIVQNSQLMVIKANNLEDPSTETIESKSFTDSSIIEGIYYAANSGADVINMSLGSSSANSLMQQAINYATSLGVILVAASGNDGTSNKVYPASFDNVISVSAVNEDETIWDHSNFNDKVDISAPGSLIISTDLKNGYATASGTSLAAPQVSGVIGLMLAYFTEFTPEQIIQQLLDSSTDKGLIGYDLYYGAGIVNAADALNVEYIMVTLDTNGGEPIESFFVVKNYIFSLSDPIKNGYVFEGWFKDSMLTDSFEVGVDSSSIDLILYAKFDPNLYQVIFVTTGNPIEPIDVLHGQTFEIPETSQLGYRFLGWYTEDTYTTSYNGEPITKNTTLYAKFEIFSYDVNYYIDDEIEHTIQVEYGDTFIPMVPISDFPFLNWYMDPEFINIYEVGPVNEDLNLYARFNNSQYTVIFYDSDQVTVIMTSQSFYGKEVIPPDEPVKVSTPSFDYIFDGWSDEFTYITEDVSIYPNYTGMYKKESVYLLPGIDTLSSMDDWIDGGLYEIDPNLYYEVRIEEDEHHLNRFFVYYDLYSENQLIDTRLRIVNIEIDNPIVITLNKDVTTIEVGTPYIDRGVSTNLGTVSMTNTVDVKTPGIYEITYIVTFENYTKTKTKYVYVLAADELYATETLYYKKEEEGWLI